jgi:rhamnose utilization protein RhaD (predicted bifunctional aldolase and dehydrogenase)
MKELEELVEISQFYGRDNRFVITGGGNTSYKNVEKIWVKASGSSLATITEEGFAILDRAKLNEMSEKVYSSNPVEREEEVKNDLAAANLTKDKRPSVETSLHNIIGYAYVVHLHPTLVNALMCSQNAESELRKLFGEKALFVEYTDPGYVLFKKVNEKLKAYRATYNEEPHVIWLQNHGIFVAADTTEEIKALYADIFSTLEKAIKSPLPEARKDIVKLLAENRITPTAMIDISDGLASDMLHICKQSKVGCVIYEERIPIDYQTASMAETFNINVTTVAMNGGEDYELLFTVPLPGIHLIGHIAPEENGCNLITRDGQEMQLRAQGWDPLA